MRTGESEYLLQKSKSSSCNVIVYIDKCTPVGVQLYHFKYEYIKIRAGLSENLLQQVSNIIHVTLSLYTTTKKE